MPTIQHITSMQRRASASGGNAGTRTVLDVDFGSVPRSSGSVAAILENSSVGDTVLASVLAGPYTGKGTLADEFEMDNISVAAQVETAGSVTIYWTSSTKVKGHFSIEVQRWQ